MRRTEVAEVSHVLDTDRAPRLRGFALLKSRGDDVSAMARRGGKAAQATGKAHRWTSEEAKAAGAKGGAATRDRPRDRKIPYKLTEKP